MGWPRRNEQIRLYQERKEKAFLLVLVANGVNGRGHYDAVANVFAGATPSLGSTSVAPGFLLNRCRRVQWSDMPPDWQDALRRWIADDDGPGPEGVRGLWRVSAAR